MFFSYFAILLAFCGIIFAFVLNTVYGMVRDNLVEMSGQAMTRWSATLSQTMEFSCDQILNLATHPVTQESLHTVQSAPRDENGLPEQKELREIGDTLRQLIVSPAIYSGQLLPFQMEICCRLPEGSYISVYCTLPRDEQGAEVYLADAPFVTQLEERKGQFMWDTIYDESYQYIRVSKTVYDTQDYNTILGSISVYFNYDHLTRSILNPLQKESGIRHALYNGEEGSFVGYYMLPEFSREIDIASLSRSKKGQLTDDEKFCVFAQRLYTTKLYLIGQKSLEDARTIYLTSCHVLFYAAGAALLLGMIATYLATRTVLRPVVQLSETMKSVKDGDLDITVSTKAKGEVGELYQSFNHMVGMINTLIQENYVTRLNQKQSELRALQSQINTHFLYNTLDSINWLAKDYHATEISELVTNLSKLLRIALNNGQPELTVERELEHVHSYIHIQQIRFRGMFHLQEEIDETLLSDTVLKMLLQPLVENAIIHAFSKLDAVAEENLLVIRVAEKDGYLLLEVANRAPCEALETALERLNSGESDAPKSYGIRSIRTRLDVAYAHQAQFTYYMEDHMLTARILIPRRYTCPDRREFPEFKE